MPFAGSPCTEENIQINSENLTREVSRLSLLSSSATVAYQHLFSDEDHYKQSFARMQNYLKSGKLCDVTLIAGDDGTKVVAHRLVLSAASEYFAAMFTGSMREATQSEIKLNGINGDILQALVNFSYSGQIEIREDNIETLLSTACLLQMEAVVKTCTKFLATQLHASNCLGIAVFAEHHGCDSLYKEATSFIRHNFMQVIDSQEIVHVTLDLMKNLLSNDSLIVVSEKHIFHAVMNWIQHDPVTRKAHMGEVLGLVRLPLLDPEFLVDHVEKAIGDDPVCQNLYIEAMKWHLLPDRRYQMVNRRTRQRMYSAGRLMVVGGIERNKTGFRASGDFSIEVYEPKDGIWTGGYSMKGNRLQFGMALVGKNQLMVVGGRDGLKTLNTMDCLILDDNYWIELPPMNTHRHGLGVAVLGGPLYAVGGHDGWSYLNTVERYDTKTRSWSYVAPMQNQRCSAGVAVLNGKLYAVGGRDGASCLRTVECYDPYTNRWTMCASMSKRRGSVGIAVANGYLFAIGGQDAPANNPSSSRFECIERYDPKTDTWTTVSSLPSKRDAVAACQYGDRIIVAGGYDGMSYLRNVELYDPFKNRWSVLAPFTQERAGACIVCLPHKET